MKEFENLQLYLPKVVAKAVAETSPRTESRKEYVKPEPQVITTVCLFADVSGFTSLTETMCSFGPSGLEDLSMNLNKFATQLVKLTTRAGGDVLKFAGDAMIALWPEVEPNDFTQRVRRAVQCAVDLQLQLNDFGFRVYDKDTDYKDIETLPGSKDAYKFKAKLQSKLGLGCGELRLLHLGGQGDLIQKERYEYVALGPALIEAIESEKRALPGQVVVSKQIWSIVSQYFVLDKEFMKAIEKEREKKRDKKYLPSYFTVKEWKPECRVPWKTFEKDIPYNVDTERKLWKYVPNAVIPYLVESNDEFWAPELRTVTTLFVDLGLNIGELASGKHTPKLEQVFFEIQGILLGYEGTINKFLIDDKGSTLIAVFGLPPLAHENDPLRGILSALKILWMLSKYQLQGSIGISTGLAFCGIIGHAAGNRREYSVIGDSVNLAARLMANAKEKQSSLLVDKITKECVKGTVFEFIPMTINVKGKAHPVHCYQISANVDRDATDYHSVHLTHLSQLSKSNAAILESPSHHKYKQKTRRRPTKAAVSNPMEMKKIEEFQVKAMNDSNGFLEKRAKAQQKKQQQKSSSESNGMDHDSALIQATSQFHASRQKESVRASRRSSSRRRSSRAQTSGIARVKFRSRTSRGEADEIETAISLGETIRTVLDLLEATIAALIRKNFLDSRFAHETDFFDLIWIRGAERVTLRPNQQISSLPRSLNLVLLKYDKRRNYASDAVTPFQNTADFIVDRLGEAEDHVMSGGGARFVLLDGDHGVGKTKLVEQFLLNNESEGGVDGCDDVLIGYARGNPFQIGRFPFFVWEHLIESLLNSEASSGKGTKVPREERIKEAIHRGCEHNPSRKVSLDLYLLNQVLLTQFEDPNFALSDASGPDSIPSPEQLHRPTHEEQQQEGRKLLKKSKMLTRSKNSGAAGGTHGTGKMSRTKNLTAIFGGNSEDSSPPPPPTSPTSAGSSLSNFMRQSKRGSRLTFRGSKTPSAVDGTNVRVSLLRVKEEDSKLSCDSDTRKIIVLLASLISGLATKAPITLVVDESNWMDTFSWLVFQELAEHWSKSTIFVILLRRLTRIERDLGIDSASSSGNHRVSVFRPDLSQSLVRSESRNKDRSSNVDDWKLSVLVQEKLKSFPIVETLELHPSASNTRDIICNAMNVDRIPDVLEDFLKKKTKGNPLYISGALQEFVSHDLITRRTHPDLEIVFTSGEFERLLNIHNLPIPLSVESIVGSMIDRMTLTQQLVMKVAAIIGEVFTVGLIRTIFPLKSKVGEIDDAFSALLRGGIITRVHKDGEMYLPPGVKERDLSEEQRDREKYCFESGWMVEVLLKRMLNKQKLKLNKRRKEEQRKVEKEMQKRFMLQAREHLEVVFESFLQVKKENSRNMLKPWKPRWCVLKGNELVQYYDRENPKRLEVIMLNEHSSVRTDPIGLFGFEANQTTPLFCFTIKTSRWEKKGRLRTDTRDFTLAAVTEEDRMKWVYRVQYQIDLLNLKNDSPSRHEPRESTSSRGAPHVPDEPTVPPHVPSQHHARGSSATVESRPSVSTVATETSSSSSKKGGGILKSVFAKRRKSLGGKERKVEYGVALQLMTPEDFKAIRAPESLNVLWSLGKPDPNVTPAGIPNHSIDMWYETSDMSIVSRNSEHAIDGYLCGKLQGGRRAHVIGLITACAVLPQARRKGIGRRLYQKFFALCRGKNCRFVRVIIPRDHSIAIAFHRSLGFEEDDYSNEILARADGSDRICFIKDLDASSQEQEEEFIECVNPMHSKKNAGSAALFE